MGPAELGCVMPQEVLQTVQTGGFWGEGKAGAGSVPGGLSGRSGGKEGRRRGWALLRPSQRGRTEPGRAGPTRGRTWEPRVPGRPPRRRIPGSERVRGGWETES